MYVCCALVIVSVAVAVAVAVMQALVGDPSKRARTVAMVNNTLPAGQLIVAVFSGAIAQHFGGFRAVFTTCGTVGFALTAVLSGMVLRGDLFTADSKGNLKSTLKESA